MKKTTVTPQATLVAQMPAGIETECVIDKGILYVPVMTLPDMGSSVDEEPEKPKVDKKVKSEPVKEEPKIASVDIEDLKVGDRIECKCADFEEPKKWYPGVVEKVKGEKVLIHFDEDEEGEFYSEDDGLTIRLMDEVKKAPKKAVKKDEDDEQEEKPKSPKKVAKPVKEDEEEEDEEEEEEEKPKKGAKKESNAASVKVKELKVGDEVSVYWSNLDDWFQGEVTKVKDGKAYVKYEDGDTEVIDPEIHTEIKRK